MVDVMLETYLGEPHSLFDPNQQQRPPDKEEKYFSLYKIIFRVFAQTGRKVSKAKDYLMVSNPEISFPLQKH